MKRSINGKFVALIIGLVLVAAGVTGNADTCLLTGFGDRGDIVMGWKMQPGGSPGILFEPDKRFRFDADDFVSVMTTNVFGVVYGIEAVLP